MKTNRLPQTLFALVAFHLALAAASDAAVTVVNFSGDVTGVIFGASAVFTTGDTFAGSFSYDDTTADASAITTLGQYGLGMQNFSVSFFPSGGGGAYYTGSQSTGFLVSNLEVSNGVSFDSLTASANSLPNPGSLTSGRFQLNFQDNDGSSDGATFSDDSLPAVPPFVSLPIRSGTWQLGALNSILLGNISASVVPEPSRALLGLLAIAAVAMRRRRY